MQTIAMGLFLAFLLYLFVTEPVLACAVGLLAFVAYREIVSLERRLAVLEADAAAEQPAAPAPKRRADEARIAQPLDQTTRATVAAMIASSPPVQPAMAKPAAKPVPPAARAETTWDRWRKSSLGEIEELVAGRLLAVVGGISLFLGGIFFLGLAFSRGWIGPELRVAIGLVAGMVLFALGGWLLRGPRQIVAHVLVAVGIGVFSLALFAGTRLQGFFTPEFGVGAALVAAVAAAALAVRFNAPIVAAFGLIAVLASPPVMGASATLLTLAFIGAALAGTTGIAIFRSWRWLPPLAFVLAAPQLASYVLGDPPIGIALGALGGFWLLNAISAVGEELHTRQYRLSPTSATVLLATAAFTVATGFGLLDGELEGWRGLYLLSVALAHFGLAAILLLRESDRHPFGMLAAGTGIAAVTMAVPIQLGAEWVPLAWAAEAVALAWIYVERKHRYSGVVAVVLGALAAAHIVVIEYPLDSLARRVTDAVPFLNPSGMALGFVVLAAGLAIWLLRVRYQRVAVAAIAVVLVAIAIPHELGGAAEAMALTALVAGSIAVQRQALGIPLEIRPSAPWTAYPNRALYGAAGIAAALLATAYFDALPVSTFLDGLASSAIPAGTPFVNEPSTVAVIVVGGALAVALVCDGRWFPTGLLAAAFAAAYLLPSQVGGAIAVAGWAVLAVGLAIGTKPIDPALRWGARALALAAGLETLGIVAPIERLWVRTSAADELAVLNGAVLAALAVAVMLAARALLPPADADRRWAGYAAGVAAVYAVSIALVDVFQLQVGGGLATEELQKQAQVALSVMWAVIGSVVTVVGLRLDRAPLRMAGLALLGVVTLKVFIVDLAALDIAYRVLSFVALGILLLIAAYLYSRMQPHTAERQGASRH